MVDKGSPSATSSERWVRGGWPYVELTSPCYDKDFDPNR